MRDKAPRVSTWAGAGVLRRGGGPQDRSQDAGLHVTVYAVTRYT